MKRRVEMNRYKIGKIVELVFLVNFLSILAVGNWLLIGQVISSAHTTGMVAVLAFLLIVMVNIIILSHLFVGE
jgi:hypothetical protein